MPLDNPQTPEEDRELWQQCADQSLESAAKLHDAIDELDETVSRMIGKDA